MTRLEINSISVKWALAGLKKRVKYHQKLTFSEAFKIFQKCDYRIEKSEYDRFRETLHSYLTTVCGFIATREDSNGKRIYVNPKPPIRRARGTGQERLKNYTDAIMQFVEGE